MLTAASTVLGLFQTLVRHFYSSFVHFYHYLLMFGLCHDANKYRKGFSWSIADKAKLLKKKKPDTRKSVWSLCDLYSISSSNVYNKERKKNNINNNPANHVSTTPCHNVAGLVIVNKLWIVQKMWCWPEGFNKDFKHTKVDSV